MAVLHAELINSTMPESQDPEPYFLRLEELQEQLGELKVVVADATLKGIVMARLPERYAPIQAVLETMKDLEYGDLKEHLLAFHARSDARYPWKDPEAAYSAVAFRGRCHECGKQGHRAAACPKRAGTGGGGQSRRRQIICWECGKPGHVRMDCTAGEQSNVAVECDALVL
jgi:hypothetical protein